MQVEDGTVGSSETGHQDGCCRCNVSWKTAKKRLQSAAIMLLFGIGIFGITVVMIYFWLPKMESVFDMIIVVLTVDILYCNVFICLYYLAKGEVRRDNLYFSLITGAAFGIGFLLYDYRVGTVGYFSEAFAYGFTIVFGTLLVGCGMARLVLRSKGSTGTMDADSDLDALFRISVVINMYFSVPVVVIKLNVLYREVYDGSADMVFTMMYIFVTYYLLCYVVANLPSNWIRGSWPENYAIKPMLCILSPLLILAVPIGFALKVSGIFMRVVIINVLISDLFLLAMWLIIGFFVKRSCCLLGRDGQVGDSRTVVPV